MKITEAYRVEIDERTDVREVKWQASPWDCADLTELVQNGAVDIEAGLMGWGDCTHTLRTRTGHAYHVRIECAP